MLLAATAVLAGAVPAASAAPITTSGSVVVRWQSNPATCADRGLCGRSGVLSWRPDSTGGSADLVEDFSFISFFGSEAIARSYRGGAGCIARVDAPTDLTAVPGPRSGTLVASMRDGADFSFGRCAGPLGSDFAAALPESRPVSKAVLRRGGLIDMRGRRSFSSGPFEGEVISTFTIRTRRTRGDSSGAESGGVRTRSPRGRRVRYGLVTASYAVESLAGDAGYAFSGAPGAECSPFDTCGLTGDVTLHTAVNAGSLTLRSKRALRPGATETVGAGLGAMRRGGTSVFGDAQLGPPEDYDAETPFAIPFSETATPPGGDTCSEAGSFREPHLSVRRARTGVLVQLLHGGNSEPDPLRTRCPGPGSDDVGTLAGAVLPLGAIGRQDVVLTLRPNPAFTTLGLRGIGRGELQLSLRLTSIHATTRTIRVQHAGLL